MSQNSYFTGLQLWDQGYKIYKLKSNKLSEAVTDNKLIYLSLEKLPLQERVFNRYPSLPAPILDKEKKLT